MVYLNQKLTKYFVILWKSYIFAVDFRHSVILSLKMLVW